MKQQQAASLQWRLQEVTGPSQEIEKQIIIFTLADWGILLPLDRLQYLLPPVSSIYAKLS